MLSAGKTDLAIEVLKLNHQAFPDHFGTYLFLARLFLKKVEHARAEEVLRKALAVQPENASVLDLLEKVRLAASLC